MANDTGGLWSGGPWGSGAADIGQSMQNFANMAASGGFAVSETGGQDMLDAIREMKDWIDGKFIDLGLLEEQLPLGSSHAAEAVKPFNVQVATDSQGFLTQLKAFRDSLEAAEAGIAKAMENYRSADESSHQKLQGD